MSHDVLNPPVIDVTEMLHELRGDMLREMPRPVGTMVSAGCGGKWYFDWIERQYGRVARHIGVEYFARRPDELPDNAVWIAGTCSDMPGIPDASADLMFSGQNIEHLWPDEVAGFLTEAARIVRPGGWLVIDSPNSAITQRLTWSHPEHTVEMTPSEMTELLRLAGFTVTKCAGLWLCRDAADGRLLPFDPNDPVDDWPIAKRIEAARERPDDSFIWWIEAKRDKAAAPDAGAIRTRLNAIFADAWPMRIQRLVAGAEMAEEQRDGDDWIVAAPGKIGIAMFGPYLPLKPGAYRVEFSLAPEPITAPAATPEPDDDLYAILDVAHGANGTVLA
ncbi:MAG: methyltransferase domain-containing protein, partial [Stellaceae bacterium]